ncbi:MAG TPA: hypothetical protein VM409_00350 [Chloroflexia bacterium]|nr:hypothetical protein [Chloroflexia bacterium]
MKTRAAPPGSLRSHSGLVGFPKVGYRLPIVVTTLAAALIFLATGFLSLAVISRVLLQLGWSEQPPQSSDPVFTFCICAPLGLLFIAGAVYFLLAVVKGARDLGTPLHYTRGSVAQPRAAIGRKSNNMWLTVDARYAGPDLQSAAYLTDEDRAASADRSQILQPRFAGASTSASRERGGYIPTHRLTSDSAEPEDSAKSQVPVTFRIDAAVLKILEPGTEVIVAHSRYLEHVYYVSHLRSGEWESFPNKALI